MEPRVGSNSNVFARAEGKLLPRFIDQVEDPDRLGSITSVANKEDGFGADTSIEANVPATCTHTEHDALSHTKYLLEDAMTRPGVPVDVVARAEDVYENLAFVGEKELAEGAQLFAGYWKAFLSEHPDASLFIVTSTAFIAEDAEDADDTEEMDVEGVGHVSDNKSDTYILDAILGCFSDEELRLYGDRLLFSERELESHDSNKIKTIVLDDWMMSGGQMDYTFKNIFDRMNPEDLEINLIIASEERLREGFANKHTAMPVPIKACFVSHKARDSYASDFGGAYLTGAHSTGDFPLEQSLVDIVAAINRASSPEEKTALPPLANIVRPYYAPDYRFMHIERYELCRALGRKGISSVL